MERVCVAKAKVTELLRLEEWKKKQLIATVNCTLSQAIDD